MMNLWRSNVNALMLWRHKFKGNIVNMQRVNTSFYLLGIKLINITLLVNQVENIETMAVTI